MTNLFIALLWLIVSLNCIQIKHKEETAAIVGPGIISTTDDEALLGVFENNTLLIFDRIPPGFKDWGNYPIYTSRLINGEWSAPEYTKHPGMPWFYNIPNPHNGQKVVYASWMPLGKNGEFTDIDLWEASFLNNNWEASQKLPDPVNTKYFDTWPTITEDEEIFYFSNRPGGFGDGDIYAAESEDGLNYTVQNLGPKINTPYLEHDPCISPDGSFLIFSSYRKEGYGRDDLYISFRSNMGEWSEALNLGNKVNSEFSENRPSLSDDSKTLYFTSNRLGQLDIYMISLKAVFPNRFIID